MKQNQLIIMFRDNEIYRSPIFEGKLIDNNGIDYWETFENLVVDGDDETGFCISCDMESCDMETYHKIVWNMFEPFDQNWLNQLFVVWKKVMGFDLPDWSKWEKIDNLDEVYS